MKPTRVTVYKETLKRILEEHNTNFSGISAKLGYQTNYLSILFARGGGISAQMPIPFVVAMSNVMAVNYDEFLKAPGRHRTEPKVVEYRQDPCELSEAIVQAINAAANMIHNDLRALLAEWKPKEPKEPKYAIKEREQP